MDTFYDSAYQKLYPIIFNISDPYHYFFGWDLTQRFKKKSLSSDQVNLTAETFFSEFTSKTESDREKAKLYLLGVQDITEGKSWCGYKTLKTITLQEFVFEYFKKLPPARMKERASNLIEEALHKSFPCKVKKWNHHSIN